MKTAGAVPELDPSVPVLVLKLGHYPLHHGVIGAIRSLGRAGVPVYGVHEDRLAPAGLWRYLTRRFVWPTTADDPEGLLQGMASMAERIGRPAILLPTDNRSAVFVAEHATGLRERFRFPKQPEQFDLLSALAYRRQGELRLAEWWSSTRQAGNLELGWLDPHDLLPVASMAGRCLFRLVVKGLRLTNTPRARTSRPTPLPSRETARSQRPA